MKLACARPWLSLKKILVVIVICLLPLNCHAKSIWKLVTGLVFIGAGYYAQVEVTNFEGDVDDEQGKYDQNIAFSRSAAQTAITYFYRNDLANAVLYTNLADHYLTAANGYKLQQGKYYVSLGRMQEARDIGYGLGAGFILWYFLEPGAKYPKLTFAPDRMGYHYYF